ncbi:MAG: DUF2892 domain-containing protein [Desulfobacterales bacterium]|nr:DUF2892 domain-containing protein [Desulfobacterales bacterium]
MKCNVGGTDRIIRIILGVVIILAGVYFKSWWGAVGILLIVTGLIRFCPAYIPFGFSTCKPDKK